MAAAGNAEQVRKPRAPLPNSPQNDYPQWCNNQGQVAVAFAEGPSWVANRDCVLWNLS